SCRCDRFAREIEKVTRPRFLASRSCRRDHARNEKTRVPARYNVTPNNNGVIAKFGHALSAHCPRQLDSARKKTVRDTELATGRHLVRVIQANPRKGEGGIRESI